MGSLKQIRAVPARAKPKPTPTPRPPLSQEAWLAKVTKHPRVQDVMWEVAKAYFKRGLAAGRESAAPGSPAAWELTRPPRIVVYTPRRDGSGAREDG